MRPYNNLFWKFQKVISYYPAESLSWYSEALSKHACMPESFHRRKMMSANSLGMEPSSMVSARCMSFLASSCREDDIDRHIQVMFGSILEPDNNRVCGSLS